MRSIFSSIIIFSALFVNAQVLDPVKWKMDAQSLGNDEFNLVFTADIQDGWTVYSQVIEGDGPIPTSINYDNAEVVELIGTAIEKGKKKSGFDKVFEIDVTKYLSDEPFTLTQKVKVKDSSQPLVGYLEFMTCDATKCLPPKAIDFEFNLASVQNIKPVQTKEQTKEQVQDKEPIKVIKEIPVNTTPNQDVKGQVLNEKKRKLERSTETPATNTENKTTTKLGTTINNDKLKANLKKKPQGQLAANPEPATQSNDTKILDPVTWSFTKTKVDDDTFDLTYTADIQEGWTVYSQTIEGDGPVPTYIEYENAELIELLGAASEKGKKKSGFDKIFEIDVTKYLSGEPFVITQRVKVKDSSQPLKGFLEFMTCDASKCLPPKAIDFAFNFESNSSASQPIASNVGMNLEGDVLNQNIVSIQESYKKPIAECGTQIQSANGSMWQIFLGGFIGGLLAILLPCIFPMIPITVSFFTKDTKTKGWVNGLIYALSIIVIFVSIGLAVTSLLGPEALNQLSTNWVANIVFFLIFVAFAFSFFGYFEITLPSSWSTKSDAMADKGGLLGTFFMAATLAIVSFSCTGPIIGTALVQVANTGNYMGPFMIMFGFSLALAIPFGLFAAFPAWLNSLPKSGSWMTNVKVVLGFIELALALKFLSVADMTSGWGFLKYELFMGLWVLIFAAMTLYLFGFFGFPHDSPVKKLSPMRTGFAILSLIWTGYIASGFMINKEINSYSIPKLVSGITPPASYNFFIPKNEVNKDVKSKYPSYTKCANDINCFKDYYEGIAYANEVNKPVLLDFTGHGCVNCRKTEDYIWKDERIKKQLNDDYVLVSLYVDERKKLPKTLVSGATGEKMRNVGNKWADFQIVNFQQNSQPLYVPITPDQKVITAPRGYEEGVDNYKQFLDCGLDAFSKI